MVSRCLEKNKSFIRIENVFFFQSLKGDEEVLLLC